MDKIEVGLLTIGQSPRDDVVPEMKSLLLPYIQVVEYGLLDDINSQGIRLLGPEDKETPLVSRLKNGSQVRLGEKKVADLLPRAVDFMTKKLKVLAVGILCTHRFPKIESSSPVISPFGCIQFLIEEMLDVRRLGIVVPLESQIEMTRKKWQRERVFIQAESPYSDAKKWEEIGESFSRHKVDAIVLDCIGYSMDDRRKIQNLIPVPTLLPRSILAYAINQFF